MNSILKAAIRKEKLALREALSAHMHAALSQRIAARLEPYLDGGVIAVYSPVRGEVDVAHVARRSNACLPVMTPDSQDMSFRQCRHGQTLQPNRHGILEPPQDAPAREPDTLIVPVVAFDREGYRIGYGGGYYDIALKRLRCSRPVLAIGVAFALQETPHVPAETFDARLDMVITEREILDFT